MDETLFSDDTSMGLGRLSNFPNPDLVDWADPYHGDNYTALLAIKREYDPEMSSAWNSRCGPDRVGDQS